MQNFQANHEPMLPLLMRGIFFHCNGTHLANCIAVQTKNPKQTSVVATNSYLVEVTTEQLLS